MRLFIMAAALMTFATAAQAGELTCWYDDAGNSTGADGGNYANAEDSWQVVDLSGNGDSSQAAALYMYWADENGTMDGSDCPATQPTTDEYGRMPSDQRPEPHMAE